MHDVANVELTKTLHRTVWRFRERYGEIFKTPTPRTAMRFMVSEIGEMIDALIREEGEDFLRNAEKNPSVEEELADVVIMALTMIPWRYHDEIGKAGLLNVHFWQPEDVASEAWTFIRDWDALDIIGNPSTERINETQRSQILTPLVRQLVYLVTSADLFARYRGARLPKLVDDKLAMIFAKRIAPKLTK